MALSSSDGNMRLIEGFIYEFKFPYILSNMYMIVDRDNHSALIVDPCQNEEALRLLTHADVRKIWIILTHEHFDHISGIPWIRERFQTKIICHENAVQAKSQQRNSRPVLAYMMREKQGDQEEMKNFFRTYKPFQYQAAKVCKEQLTFHWNMHEISLIHAPGHSPASILIQFDGKYVFTGDSLIPNIPVITRFPGGDQVVYESITLPILRSIGPDRFILPGHGEPVVYHKLQYHKGVFEMI